MFLKFMHWWAHDKLMALIREEVHNCYKYSQMICYIADTTVTDFSEYSFLKVVERSYGNVWASSKKFNYEW